MDIVSSRLSQGQGSQRKKKRYCIGSLIAALLVAAVVVIVLVLKASSGGGDDGGGGHHPHPENPLDFQEYNPFKLHAPSLKSQSWYYEGVLDYAVSKNTCQGRKLSTQQFLKEHDQAYYQL